MGLLPTSTSSSSSSKPLKSSPPNPNFNAQNSSSTSTALCKHSPSATLDLLILILVLFSGAFLLISYLSYLFHSLSLLISSSSFYSYAYSYSYSYSSSSIALHLPPASYILGFIAFFLVSFLLADFCCGPRSRRCNKPGCKGLKKSMEFDLQLQTEDCVKSGGAATKETDGLPWKGGSEGNPDYECLRAELRKMAPPNGRAVLLFRARCGCPVAKLEGWGPKRGRRRKKALANVAANRDHR